MPIINPSMLIPFTNHTPKLIDCWRPGESSKPTSSSVNGHLDGSVGKAKWFDWSYVHYQTHSTILEGLRTSLQPLAEAIAGRVALFAP